MTYTGTVQAFIHLWGTVETKPRHLLKLLFGLLELSLLPWGKLTILPLGMAGELVQCLNKEKMLGKKRLLVHRLPYAVACC